MNTKINKTKIIRDTKKLQKKTYYLNDGRKTEATRKSYLDRIGYSKVISKKTSFCHL